MKSIILVLSTAMICFGCYQEQADARVQAEPRNQPDARKQTFAQLTRNSWTTVVKSGFHPDRFVYRFCANGSYRVDYLTDVEVKPGEGKWNFLQDDEGTWWIIFDNGQRERFLLNDDGTLTFMNKQLHVDKPLDQTRTVEQLAPIKVSDSVQKIAKHLCANPWQRSNDVNLSTQPTLVEFRPDWTYTTTYRYGKCRNQGDWYATSHPLIARFGAAKIRADSLHSECDTRGPGREQLRIEIIDGIGVLINSELYVPQEAATNKAVIWAIFGRESIRVSVHYDMPIVQGVPHRFDVEFRIVKSISELTLQRFSLTEKYDHGYRLANHKLGDVAEIAATDLNSKVLKHGDVHKASITATFDKPGTQYLYFNAMMFNIRQDWDARCGYEMQIRPSEKAELDLSDAPESPMP